MHKRNASSWKPRSALERAFMVVTWSGVLICIARAVGTAEAMGIHSPAKDGRIVSREAGNEDICLSLGCNHTASTVLKNMDPNVDPCHDFYRFACGGFLKSTVVPDGKDHVHVLSLIQDKVRERLRTILEKPSVPNERKPFRLVKDLYKSCVNAAEIEEQSLETFRGILEKLGGWPVIDGKSWNEDNFNWIDSTYKVHDAGYSTNYFFSFGMGFDWYNHTRNVFTLDTGDLGLDYEYLSKGANDENVKAYYNYMVDIAVLLGAQREYASKELMETLSFEISLANISVPINVRDWDDSMYPLWTMDELTNNYPSVPWREYYSKLLPKKITIQENDLSRAYTPMFDVLKLLSKTPKRVLANYVVWRAVKASVKYLNDDIREKELVYSTALNGKSPIKPRWEECVDNVRERLPIGVGAMYVREYFNEEAKQYVYDMVMDIKQQINNIFQQIEPMSLRTELLEELRSTSFHVAYTDEYLDDAILEKVYENLELSGKNYFENILNLNFFDFANSFEKFRELLNKNDWLYFGRTGTHPAAVRIHESIFSNSFYVTAGLLQDPLFSMDIPKYMNYGSLGFMTASVIAFMYRYHEVNHNPCIRQQYENITTKELGFKPDINHEWINVAENSGIKTAYLAYTDWAGKNDPEKQLPGLQYSPNQMFWISTANAWCTKFGPEGSTKWITTKWRSPPEIEILGMLSNMPQFANDFSCPIGSRMNPEEKCSVW